MTVDKGRMGDFAGRVRTCVRFKEDRNGDLRCARFEPAEMVGPNPCSPPELVGFPLGKSPGLVREEEISCAGPTIKPLRAPPGVRAGRLHREQPTDVDDPRLLAHGRRAPRRRRRAGNRG